MNNNTYVIFYSFYFTKKYILFIYLFIYFALLYFMITTLSSFIYIA